MSLLIETVGFIGSGLAVLTYWMRGMVALRIVSLIGCLFFILYAMMIGSAPILLMELTLLPINLWRLVELQHSSAAAERQPSWPQLPEDIHVVTGAANPPAPRGNSAKASASIGAHPQPAGSNTRSTPFPTQSIR